MKYIWIGQFIYNTNKINIDLHMSMINGDTSLIYTAGNRWKVDWDF